MLDRDATKRTRQFCSDAILCALGQYLYRGISVNVTAQYQKFLDNKHLSFPWWTFSSASKSEQVVALRRGEGVGT